MRIRCRRCGKLATTRHACKSCGSARHLIHCHNREHMNHNGWRAVGYDHEDLGICPAFTWVGFHLHPYNFAASGTPEEDHRNAPAHYAYTDQRPPIADWLGQPVTGQAFEEKP